MTSDNDNYWSAFQRALDAANAYADAQAEVTEYRDRPTCEHVVGLQDFVPSTVPARFERPAVENYLRCERDLPDGGCIDLGLEDPEGTDAALAGSALELCLDSATEFQADSKQIALKLKALIEEWFPDRYWFAEVWTPSGAVKRYQVIQPAVVGGFRR